MNALDQQLDLVGKRSFCKISTEGIKHCWFETKALTADFVFGGASICEVGS